MVDKDDLFQEEDGTDPQDHEGDELSSDEDDDIIDLFDTVEMPSDAVEEDIIELEDLVEAPQDDILELTEEVQPSLIDDDVPGPSKVQTESKVNDFIDTIEIPGKDIEEDVIELADIAQETDHEALDITQELEPEADGETIDLTEPVIGDEPDDEAIDLLDTIELPGKDIEDDVIELADIAQETDHEALDITQELEPETADETIDLTEPAIGDEPDDETIDLLDTIEMHEKDIDYLNTVEMPKDDKVATDLDDNSLGTVEMDESPSTGEDTLDEFFNLAETVEEDRPDQAVMNQMAPVESMEPDQEERATEPAIPPAVGYEEDKELLELIDDIQATLNDEPLASHADDQEDISEKDEVIDTGAPKEDAESYIYFDDDEIMDDKETPQSETEFVDHLGIDLTSEIERKAPEESQEASLEGVPPTEAMEAAVKRALTEMLADENNPLVKAIENAVKRALG